MEPDSAKDCTELDDRLRLLLTQKVAVVTGASGGLGREVALGLARVGAHVALISRTLEGVDRSSGVGLRITAEEIEAKGGVALPMVCDLADVRAVRRVMQAVESDLGPVDVLVNNAAMQARAFTSTISPSELEYEFRVNVFGGIACIQAVLPSMVRRGRGHVINVSSTAAGGPSHYGATKAALESLTTAIARETSNKGLVVNAIKPERPIMTPGLRSWSHPGQVGSHRFQQPVSPETFVKAVMVLATAEPSFSGRIISDLEVLTQVRQEPAAFWRRPLA